MAEVSRYSLTDDPEAIVASLRTDGAVIIENAMSPELHRRVTAELEPWINVTPSGRDDFTGRQTSRTGALVARSEASRELVMEPTIIDLANRFLEPFTNKIQLHLTQVITIQPGQGTQPLHRDRLAWGGYIPNEIEPQFNTLWALTDFTEENGATRLVPGSVSWEDDRRAGDDEKCQAVMPAGSVLVYSGSVIHGGGENKSTATRSGVNITYCLAWLRTEENQFLSCPPDYAMQLDPELQELMGYSMGNYALGYYSDPEAIDGPTDILPPEYALGRAPRPVPGQSFLG